MGLAGKEAACAVLSSTAYSAFPVYSNFPTAAKKSLYLLFSFVRRCCLLFQSALQAMKIYVNTKQKYLTLLFIKNET